MFRIILNLETVTPAFLGNARQQPEFRPASVRGELRYWLRALVGGGIGDADLEQLHQFETSVFGNTDHGSAVTVRLSHNFDQRNRVLEPLLPHRNDNTAGAIDAIPCGTPFNLLLSLQPARSREKLELATWCALLWVTLGGIGRRSRRGAGSSRLTGFSFSEDSYLPSQELRDCMEAVKRTGASGSDLAIRIGNLIANARTAFPASANRRSNNPPHYSVLLDDTRIVVWTPGNTNLNDYKTALRQLMNKLSDEKSLSHLGPNLFARSFGGIGPRRASPLHVATHRLENEWALVCTHFNAKIQANDNGQPEKVTDFLNALSPKFEAYPKSSLGGGTT